jgi:hypothetical protein
MNKQTINNIKKCRPIASNFYYHADTAVQCRVHCLMELIHGFIRSHWMPPLGKCLRHIALVAAKVIDFE